MIGLVKHPVFSVTTNSLLHQKKSKSIVVDNIPALTDLVDGQSVRVFVNGKLREYTRERGVLFYNDFKTA
jgi:hypothetical protein